MSQTLLKIHSCTLLLVLFIQPCTPLICTPLTFNPSLYSMSHTSLKSILALYSSTPTLTINPSFYSFPLSSTPLLLSIFIQTCTLLLYFSLIPTFFQFLLFSYFYFLSPDISLHSFFSSLP